MRKFSKEQRNEILNDIFAGRKEDAIGKMMMHTGKSYQETSQNIDKIEKLARKLGVQDTNNIENSHEKISDNQNAIDLKIMHERFETDVKPKGFKLIYLIIALIVIIIVYYFLN